MPEEYTSPTWDKENRRWRSGNWGRTIREIREEPSSPLSLTFVSKGPEVDAYPLKGRLAEGYTLSDLNRIGHNHEPDIESLTDAMRYQQYYPDEDTLEERHRARAETARKRALQDPKGYNAYQREQYRIREAKRKVDEEYKF